MDPAQTDALCQQARQCLQDHEFETSRQYYTAVVSECDTHIEAFEGLATSLIMLGETAAAIETYHRLAVLEPQQARHFVNLGALYNRLGDFTKAIDALRKAVNRDRRNADAYYNQGYAFRKLGQLALAATAYRDAVRINPNLVEGFHNLANVLFEQGNLLQAHECFRQALMVDPEFHKAAAGLAKVEAALRDQQLAAHHTMTVQPPGGPGTSATARPQRTLCRELSDQERMADRRTVLHLSQELEVLTDQCSQFLKNTVEVVMHEVQKEIAQPQPNKNLQPTVTKLQRTLEQWAAVREAMRRKVLELRAHEEIVNTPELDLSALHDLLPHTAKPSA